MPARAPDRYEGRRPQHHGYRCRPDSARVVAHLAGLGGRYFDCWRKMDSSFGSCSQGRFRPEPGTGVGQWEQARGISNADSHVGAVRGQVSPAHHAPGNRTAEMFGFKIVTQLLQTVVEVAAEKNSTLVMPFPVELLRFFDRAARPGTRT